jgi:hypothetical protein
MKENIVYVIQEIPGTKTGSPKINIMGAGKYGKFKFLLPELSQIIFSPGPLIFKLRNLLKTNGKYNLLKWDKQERQYYPIEINLYERGKIDE